MIDRLVIIDQPKAPWPWRLRRRGDSPIRWLTDSLAATVSTVETLQLQWDPQRVGASPSTHMGLSVNGGHIF